MIEVFSPITSHTLLNFNYKLNELNRVFYIIQYPKAFARENTVYRSRNYLQRLEVVGAVVGGWRGGGYELSPKTRGRKGGSGGGEGVWSIESWAQQLIDGAHLSIFAAFIKGYPFTAVQSLVNLVSLDSNPRLTVPLLSRSNQSTTGSS